MSTRVRVEDTRDQEQHARPQPGTAVKIAVDLSRSKWVYCVRWDGAERLRLRTGGELKHLQALVRRYEGCAVHLAFEACGFGYRLRAAMLQCGWASVRTGGDASLRAVYDRLAPRTGKKRAIIAVTRRLVVRLRARWLEALEEGKAAAA